MPMRASASAPPRRQALWPPKPLGRVAQAKNRLRASAALRSGAMGRKAAFEMGSEQYMQATPAR